MSDERRPDVVDSIGALIVGGIVVYGACVLGGVLLCGLAEAMKSSAGTVGDDDEEEEADDEDNDQEGADQNREDWLVCCDCHGEFKQLHDGWRCSPCWGTYDMNMDYDD